VRVLIIFWGFGVFFPLVVLGVYGALGLLYISHVCVCVCIAIKKREIYYRFTHTLSSSSFTSLVVEKFEVFVFANFLA